MLFPLSFRPAESYHERPRSFGAPRDGGTRSHAGCDLYAPIGTPVRAVADASRWVAEGGAAGFRGRGNQPAPSTLDGFAHRIARTREAGGVVVATGGCFDVLHAGHAQYLRAARELGDLLVVLLNSDASVRRLKGPGRPVNPVADRRALL